MRRRDFIAGFVGAAIPFAARAQQANGIRRIGVLVLGNPNPEPFLKELRDALRKLGHVEGRELQLEVRSAGAKASALPDAAADLVRLKVDIIVAWQTPAATAAKQATADIPIVMSAGNPVETGLVASLSRPGSNVTGLDSFGAQLGGKCVELIRDTLPSARRVAILANVADPFTKSFVAEIEKAASSIGIATQPIMRRPGDEFDAAFAEMRSNGADAVIIQPTLLSQAVVDLALRHRLPSFSIDPVLPATGGLMAYSVGIAYRVHELVGYVDRILKGSKPADLPVVQPTKFELVINLKTAKALGIDIPATLLARADEVIE
jgi:putative ABC transport system substrate-binding protein